MAVSLAGGALRVEPPEAYRAEAGRETRARTLPATTDTAGTGDPGATPEQALVDALADSGMTEVARVVLTPQRERRLGEPREGGTMALELDLPAEEDGVVLLEHDGVWSWHLPVNRRGRSRSPQPGGRTARFEISLGEAPPPEEEQRTRGLLGGAVQGVVQALVFRFAAPILVERAVEVMERHVQEGLVHLTGPEPSTWRRRETLDEIGLPTDRDARLLLLIHGTFDSTMGAFGPMGLDEAGQGFLRTALSSYDAVVGFDHRTLSLDPRQNAEDLLRRLSGHHPGSGLTLDIVTHSRGGLTTRSFVEQVLPGSGWPATVGTVVFAGATHAGTRLADPERWSDLVDLYTNLTMITAKALALVPGAGPVANVVAGVVKGIGAFVKYLVAYAAESDDVPGLKAMVPNGEFVTELNRTQPGQPGPGTDWYVLSSDFHVELFDDHHLPAEFPRELVVRLAEGVLDRLFQGPNDLVVETASMDAIDLEVGGFVRDRLALSENERVHHLNYFVQQDVLAAMASWLPMGEEVGEPEPLAGGEPPRERWLDGGGAPVTRGLPPDLLAERSAPPPAGAPPPPPPAGTPPPPPAGAPPPQPQAREEESRPREEEPAETTRAHLAAEMPAQVVAEREFAVRVRLSRRALEPSEGTVHEAVEVDVDSTRPLNVEVIGKANAEVVGPDADVFALPAGGGTSELQFTLRPLATGPVTVTVVVRQGRVPVARVDLTATAVDASAAVQHDDAGVVTATVHTGIDAPELEGLPCLDIVERALPHGAVIYQYALRLDPGQDVVRFDSAEIKDRERRIGLILDSVAEVWKQSSGAPDERERKLQDIGSKLFDEFFPEPMQDYLWTNRAKVKDLILYADEPFVPWELVHLKPASGPRPEEPSFLAQAGLVRWQLGSFPPREMRVRQGRARSLCPEYADPRFALSAPVAERLFLEERFDATPVTATPNGVRELLRSGQFDLLHFSGHGAADPSDILDAKLLLQGRERDGTVEPEYLGATTVSENCRPPGEGEVGPVVVLNACQVGRSGELLSTVGGFAKAFLDAGASAFVSCLWSVHEEPSRFFVEKLYEELLAGTPMAKASARAREETRKAGDATWLAFVVYSRPDAVLVRS